MVTVRILSDDVTLYLLFSPSPESRIKSFVWLGVQVFPHYAKRVNVQRGTMGNRESREKQQQQSKPTTKQPAWRCDGVEYGVVPVSLIHRRPKSWIIVAMKQKFGGGVWLEENFTAAG